jgi:hypothetical protein
MAVAGEACTRTKLRKALTWISPLKATTGHLTGEGNSDKKLAQVKLRLLAINKG